jgi:hypoxanthine phosphoribosyltransferase
MALKLDNKLYLSWNNIENSVDELCKKITESLLPINSIHGLARGGYIPAVMISHKLNIPYSTTVLRDTLVIDDICDSGKTLEKAPGLYHAVLHYKPHTSSFVPTLWAKEMGDEWIVYPWERSDAAPIQDYLQSDEFKEFAERVDEQGPWSEEDDKINTIGGLTNDKEGSFMKFQNKINKKDNE